MNKFLSFNVGNQTAFGGASTEEQNRTVIASNAPRVYSASGKYLDRWPTNLASTPGGAYPQNAEFFPHGGGPYPGEEPSYLAPGGGHALNCPTVDTVGFFGPATNFCPGDVSASADLSHFLFASRWNVFAAGGRLSAPGSVYDNDTAAATVTVASKTPAGETFRPSRAEKGCSRFPLSPKTGHMSSSPPARHAVPREVPKSDA